MTPLIREYTRAGISEEFYELLTDFGRWAQFSGCKGFFGAHKSDPPRFIDDESAMQIDAAFCRLKDENLALFEVMRMYFIKRLDADLIEKILKVLRQHNRGGWEQAVKKYHVTHALVDELVRRGAVFVLDTLRG